VTVDLKAAVYGVLDRVTLRRGWRRTINGDDIRFPPRWSRYYPRDYQPHTHAFLRRHCRVGTLALDVGAHIGLFTVLMARCVGARGRVIAFEPAPRTAAALASVLQLNGCTDVVAVRQEAVTRESGYATLFVTSDVVSNANSTVPLASAATKLAVEASKVNDIVAEYVEDISCIKIDVEGAEFDVIVGALSTLRHHRPALAIDVHPELLAATGASLGGLWDVLTDEGYEIQHKTAPRDRRWFCGQEALFDVQALPRARQ
jgi:FkbM family methyltransferase